jgi:hypothetical protein
MVSHTAGVSRSAHIAAYQDLAFQQALTDVSHACPTVGPYDPLREYGTVYLRNCPDHQG